MNLIEKNNDIYDINDCDVVVLHCIYNHLDIEHLLIMKQLSKWFYKTICVYLRDRFWRSEYLENQNIIIQNRINKLDKEYERLLDIKYNILKYRRVHGGCPPDGYIAYVLLKAYNNVSSDFEIQWQYCSVDVLIENNSHILNMGCILVKYQSERNMEKIMAVINKYKWKEIYIPSYLKQSKKCNDIAAAYGYPNVSKRLLKKMCRVCKKNHTLFECQEVMCGVCKLKGHLTRNCPNIKCKMCNQFGHLPTRCPRMVCFKCGKHGHIQKRCHSKTQEISH